MGNTPNWIRIKMITAPAGHRGIIDGNAGSRNASERFRASHSDEDWVLAVLDPGSQRSQRRRCTIACHVALAVACSPWPTGA